MYSRNISIFQKLLQEIDLIILQIVDNQLTLEQLVMTKRTFVRKELFFRIAELANSAFSTDEKKRLDRECYSTHNQLTLHHALQ